jgi:tetratricopeptide (TPR) repeat protein
VRAQAGFHSAITSSLFLETRVALPFYYLGERNLAGPEVALTVNYLLKPAEIIMTRADKHFLEGKRLYEAGQFTEADAEFTSALKSDSAHAGALNYRRMIAAHGHLARARASREKQETWSALANYQQAATYLSQAEQELREYRATLATGVPAMVTEGIGHYEARRYAECERLMEHVLLIQPDNEQARIYLPRARSRRQALQKLQ